MQKSAPHTKTLNRYFIFQRFYIEKINPLPLQDTLTDTSYRTLEGDYIKLRVFFLNSFSWMNIDPISVASVQFHMAVCTTQHSRKFLNHNSFSQTFPSIHLLLIIFWAQAYFLYCYNYISIILLLYFVFFITFTLSTTVIWVII